jgi:methionine biosynthesis protein MetW
VKRINALINKIRENILKAIRYFYMWYMYIPIKEEMPMKEVADDNLYWQERKGGTNSNTLFRALLLERYLDKGNTLLDIGCGNGVFISHFKKKGLVVEGIDISDTAVNICKEKGLNARKINLLDSGYELEKKYDYIVALCILEHVRDPEIIMRKIKGHFKKKLFIAVPNIGFLPYRIRLLFGKFPVTSIFFHIREHIRFWTVHDFKYWSNQLGFEIVKYISNENNVLSNALPSLFSANIIYVLKEKTNG